MEKYDFEKAEAVLRDALELISPPVSDLVQEMERTILRMRDVVQAAEMQVGHVELEAKKIQRDASFLADEVDVLVARGVIDSRSPAADALLSFRRSPRSDRSDRLAELERRLAIAESAKKAGKETGLDDGPLLPR